MQVSSEHPGAEASWPRLDAGEQGEKRHTCQEAGYQKEGIHRKGCLVNYLRRYTEQGSSTEVGVSNEVGRTS